MSGRHFAVGGTPRAGKTQDSPPAHMDDWECTSSGRPIPQFSAGTGSGAWPLDWRSRPHKKYGSSHVTGVAKPVRALQSHPAPRTSIAPILWDCEGDSPGNRNAERAIFQTLNLSWLLLVWWMRAVLVV